jgi:micrococcal nuclease
MTSKILKLLILSITIDLLGMPLTNVMKIQFLESHAQAAQNLQQAKVTKIIDGDTLEVAISGKIFQVQLSCIDTPEVDSEPFFTTSKNRLKALLPIGTSVLVRDTGKRVRNRIVAEIFLGNRSINLQLVQEGKAVIFCKHLDNCQGTQQSYLNAEANARKKGLGVWNPTHPWRNAREAHPCPR